MVFLWASSWISGSRSFILYPVFDFFGNPLMYYRVFTTVDHCLYKTFFSKCCCIKIVTYTSFYFCISFNFLVWDSWVKNASTENCCCHKSTKNMFCWSAGLLIYFHWYTCGLTHLPFSLTIREVPQSLLQGPRGSSSHLCRNSPAWLRSVLFINIDAVQRFDLKYLASCLGS